MHFSPKLILLFSGKRKSGKDYIAERLWQALGDDKSTIIHISEPIKSRYAKQMNLDLNLLMSDGAYKETFRKEMIEWSDSVRLKDPGYFCKLACDKASEKEVWIVSDVRRETDVTWFQQTFPGVIKCVRIVAEDAVRQKRGFRFTQGIDDVISECGLDNYDKWDLVVLNNNNEEFDMIMQQLKELVEQCTS